MFRTALLTLSVGAMVVLLTGCPTGGSVYVHIDPPEVVEAGAQWSVDGENFQDPGAWVQVGAGEYTVTFSNVDGWITPSAQTVVVPSDEGALVTATYEPGPTGALTVTILPAEAAEAGAQWRVDGGSPQDSGDTMEGLAAGEHTVSFTPLSGWTVPEDVTVEITAEETESITAEYSLQADTGALIVELQPLAAVASGAQWRVDGGVLQDSGEMVAGLEPGPHTVTFTVVSGWTAPADRTVQITAGEVASITAEYQLVAPSGSLTVTIEPAAAVIGGAQWRVDGGSAHNSGETVTGLPVGAHTVSFTAITGWTAPADLAVDIAANATTSVSGEYQQLIGTGALNVMIQPQGAIDAGAQWRVDGGPLQNSSETVFQLAAGPHTVSFAAVPNWTAPADALVNVLEGQTATFTGTYSQGGLTTSHANRFTTYEGSKTCIPCHLNKAQELHASVHYQWSGPTPYVVNMESGGKLGGINDFCTYPDISWIGRLTNLDGVVLDGGCSQCHVGMGAKPLPEPSQAQLENMDCLMCHADSYKRKVVDTPNGLRWGPAPEKMTVPLLQAITDIHLPTNSACVDCHSYAGGGCNNKRGDLEEAHRFPHTADFDVHMASEEMGGAGLRCLDCHYAEGHRIAGRGVDLRPTDLDVQVTCTNCHPSEPHHEYQLDQHTGRVNCTVCHIPMFAKIGATDMLRDYSMPPTVNEARRLYEPYMVKENNVVPEYRFWNGLSYIYQFGTPVSFNEDGFNNMAEPLGSVTDSGSKLHAFKHHLGVQAYDPFTQAVLPVKMGILFQTANVDRAIIQGATETGFALPLGYEFINTDRYMGIFHEVAPADQALRCNACHFGGSRVDFAGLGYTPKTTRNNLPLCASCHEDESGEWPTEFFTKVHDKHVKDKQINCIECHNFSAAKSNI